MDTTVLLPFFGWMSVINLVLFALGMLKVTVFRNLAAGIGRAILGDTIDAWMADAPRIMMNYYILILVFNVVPYLALRCL